MSSGSRILGSSRTEIFNGSNTLVINSDGSINIGASVLPSGAATSANQVLEIAQLTAINGKLNSLGQKTMANSMPVAIASDQSAIPASQSGSWTVTANAGTNLNTSALNLETTQTAFSAKFTSSTATIYNIARSNVSQVALAANANRKGCNFVNDTGAICYISYAATSTTTSYTFRLVSNGYYEMNHPIYTGVISVIFATNGTNTLNITELT